MASSPEVMPQGPQGPQGPPQPQPMIQNGPQPQPPRVRNPCPCCQLRIGVLTVAILQLIFFLCLGISSLIGVVMKSNGVYGVDPITSKPLALHACILLTCISGFIMALVLLFAAIKKSITLVKIAFVGSIIVYVSLMGEVLWDLFLERDTLSMIFNLFVDLVGTILELYVLYTVHAYIKELTLTNQGVVTMMGGSGGDGQSSVTPSQQSYPQASASNVGSASNMGSPQPGTP